MESMDLVVEFSQLCLTETVFLRGIGTVRRRMAEIIQQVDESDNKALQDAIYSVMSKGDCADYRLLYGNDAQAE